MIKRKMLRDLPQLCDALERNEFVLDAEFPHVASKITELWGIPELFNTYATSLVVHVPSPERPVRAGFPAPALFEIGDIVHAHGQLYPVKLLPPFELDPKPVPKRIVPKPKKGLLSRLLRR